LSSPLHDFPVFTLPVPNSSKPTPPVDENLAKPELYVETILRAMLRRLSDHEKKALGNFVTEKCPEMKYASVCAGTDSPRLVFDAFARVCNSEEFSPYFNQPISASHCFSGEIVPAKRDFLAKVYQYQQQDLLFSDVRGLGGKTAENYMQPLEDGSYKQVDIPDYQFLVGGFPCKDVSSMNSQRSKNRDNIGRRAGKTGAVFAGILECEKAHNKGLMVSWFENVKGLAIPPKANRGVIHTNMY
jgi:hypothetical protein